MSETNKIESNRKERQFRQMLNNETSTYVVLRNRPIDSVSKLSDVWVYKSISFASNVCKALNICLMAFEELHNLIK